MRAALLLSLLGSALVVALPRPQDTSYTGVLIDDEQPDSESASVAPRAVAHAVWSNDTSAAPVVLINVASVSVASEAASTASATFSSASSESVSVVPAIAPETPSSAAVSSSSSMVMTSASSASFVVSSSQVSSEAVASSEVPVPAPLVAGTSTSDVATIAPVTSSVEPSSAALAPAPVPATSTIVVASQASAVSVVESSAVPATSSVAQSSIAPASVPTTSNIVMTSEASATSSVVESSTVSSAVETSAPVPLGSSGSSAVAAASSAPSASSIAPQSPAPAPSPAATIVVLSTPAPVTPESAPVPVAAASSANSPAVVESTKPAPAIVSEAPMAAESNSANSTPAPRPANAEGLPAVQAFPAESDSTTTTTSTTYTTTTATITLSGAAAPSADDSSPWTTVTITDYVTYTDTVSCHVWTTVVPKPASAPASPEVLTLTMTNAVTGAAPSASGMFSSPSSTLTSPQAQSAASEVISIDTIMVTLRTTLTTSEVQTQLSTVTVNPATQATVLTSLETSGRATESPFNPTVVATPSAQISPITSGSAVISSTTSIMPTAAISGNLFVPMELNAPPAQITTRGNHPVPTTGINQTIPLQTNKFYANFFLGNRSQPTWTHPYSVAWSKGMGETLSWGISVSHVERSQVVYGSGTPASYFINPVGLQSLVLSARELGASTSMTMDTLKAFSANVNLAPTAGATPMITFPLVQGMGFVTGVYNNGTPLIQSGLFYKNLTYAGAVMGSSTVRYQIVLNDNTMWLLYLTPASNSATPILTLADNSHIVGNKAFSGTIQVAKNPNGTLTQNIYDGSSGVYPLRGSVAAAAKGNVGSYSLSWTKGGVISRPLLMFALPHHVEEFASGFSNTSINALKLETTTKGIASGVVADMWNMTETDLPSNMGFAPWSPGNAGGLNRQVIPAAAVSLLKSVAATELNEDMQSQTDLDSMYYSGKGLAKFAMIVWATNSMANNTGVASAGLAKLKLQYSRFVNNTQINPLVYDSTWGGAVSSAGYPAGQALADFGNTYYNDHHFHYGYFVYTAAVIGSLDPSWLTQGTNKAWVDMLVRDYANPASNDPYFPFSRMFDWYHGHSWAHGLFESGDGKDEESSSEDAFSSYGLKMWGQVSGDANMEARGNLMLAITARSLQNYFLMQQDNTVQPPNFINNRASGILFENKVDHTTYFGTNIEYIEGIHMLPLNPSSTLTRTNTFVTQEWNQYFSNGRADAVVGGWRGILYANLAIIDPKTSYNFFAQSGFDNSWLDGGASRTWYLALAAGLGGAS